MSDTTVHSNNEVTQWDDKFFREYVRDSRFARYMATDENAVITIKEDLTTKPGSAITISLVTRLTGAGVSGNALLEGNEENLGNYGHKVNVTTYRHGVVVTAEEEQKTAIGLRNAGRSMLKLWSMEHTRDKIITALGSISTADGTNTAYASASEANKDTWLTNNSDRVLCGVLTANTSSLDHSTSLANIDNTADKLSPSMISTAKRMAQLADPHITPIRVDDDEEWFVMFANSRAMRDLRADSTITQANREAMERGKNNPLFKGGDLIWDGVIIREVPEIGTIGAVGASSIVVGANYLCGAQALGIAYAKRWKSKTQTTDYDFRYGVGIEGNYGVEKLFFNTKQNGVVTVYAAAVADA